MKFILSILVSLGLTVSAFGQYFEGELEISDIYLTRDSLKLMFDPKPEIMFLKGPKVKSVMPEASQGAMEWEIFDYRSNIHYLRKSYKDVNYTVTNKPPTYSKDGKIQFAKPDSQLVAPILKNFACLAQVDTLDVLTDIDTTFDIDGTICKLMVRDHDGHRVSEYYYTDSIRLNPEIYSCFRGDHLDKFYKKTKGALLMQRVEYTQGYVWLQQIKKITPKRLDDSIFDLPKGVKNETLR